MFAKRLQQLHPYVPGEQPKDRTYIKLNANENAYPPSKAVSEAIASTAFTHPEVLARYADPDADALREAIASMLNSTGGCFCNAEKAAAALKKPITADMIFCGNGSDEVLSFVFYAFFDSTTPVVTLEHTYSFYPVYAGYYGIDLYKVPLDSDWSVNPDALMDAVEKCSATGMIFANPNAPTGRALSMAQIRQMLDRFPKDKVFVVDEAYADFGTESAVSLLAEYPNLLVIRTFSKSLSFAGMRLGFCVGNPDLITAVITVKNSFNHFPVDAICQVAGQVACNDTGYYVANAEKTAETRDAFSARLTAAGYTVVPSKTNFIMVQHPTLSGAEVYQKVKSAGILIRHFATPGIEKYVRITIGTPEQMDRLAEVMEQIR